LIFLSEAVWLAVRSPLADKLGGRPESELSALEIEFRAHPPSSHAAAAAMTARPVKVVRVDTLYRA
jgi:hypothetical protein